jgi:tRNA pseudouridine55 synthase
MDGVLIINKPAGITSHDVVGRVRRIFSMRQVGHCGTLDPFATGLLLVTLGKATKISRFLEAEQKTYRATLRLGEATDSLDCDGTIIDTQPVPLLKESFLVEMMHSFLGEQDQIPPMYSAVKIGGKKLYELARKGETVVRDPRRIVVTNMTLLSYHEPMVEFRVNCSRGTYVRVLASDLAIKLGTVGHLVQLHREAIGSRWDHQAISLENLSVTSPLLSIREALGFMTQIGLSGSLLHYAQHGRPLSLDAHDPYVLLFDQESKLPVAIYEQQANQYICLRGI